MILLILSILFYNIRNINAFNLNITNSPFNIISNIVTENTEIETCKVSTSFGLNKMNVKYLCNSIIISPNYIISPYTCLIKDNNFIDNIFVLYNNKLYDIDYIITDNDINKYINIDNLLSVNNKNNLVIIKLINNIDLILPYANTTNNIIYNSTINDINNFSDTNKLLIINNNITIVNKKTTLFNLTYPIIKRNDLKYSNNMNINNNYYYYHTELKNSNIDINLLNVENIYNNFNNTILINTVYSGLYLEYRILCMETLIYEYKINDKIIQLNTCIPLNTIYDIYNSEIRNNLINHNYKKNKIKYTIVPIIKDNVKYYDSIKYDNNCRIITNNIFYSNSNKLLLNYFLFSFIIMNLKISL